VELADVITSFRRHWRAAVGSVVLVAVGLGLFLFLSDQTRPPERWRGAVQILVPSRDQDGNLPQGVPAMLLQGQESIALGPAVTGDALTAAGLDEDEVTFDFETNERGDVYTLTVTAPTSEDAKALADGYARAYVAARRALVAQGSTGASQGAQLSLAALQDRFNKVEADLRRLDPDLLARLPDRVQPANEPDGTQPDNEDAGTDQEGAALNLPPSTPMTVQLLAYERQDLLGKIEATRRNYARGATDAIVPQAFAQTAERAVPEDITREPLTPLIPIGAAIGLAVLVGLGVPVLLDRIDHSIRDSQAASTALAAPVLSTIPAVPASRLETLARPGSPAAHAYRTLATASVATDQLPRAIAVTSPTGQMQDTVAANFAAALADLGLRVVLVPTDARQGWYAEAPDGALTLPDFLALAHTGRLNGEVPHQLQPTPVDNLRIVPHSDTEADALIDGLPPLLRSFADGGVDVTVIAAPSILEDPAATILAWSTRSVLWVVETGEVTQQQANEAAAKLEMAGASPFGVAVVDRKG
jgi:Mrp family chromosome partitioning ATPase